MEFIDIFVVINDNLKICLSMDLLMDICQKMIFFIII